MNATLTTQRHQCRPTYFEESTSEDVVFMDEWWGSVGRHSDYFRVQIHDAVTDQLMTIHSPTFRRDNPAAAEAAFGSVMHAAANTLISRFGPELLSP